VSRLSKSRVMSSLQCLKRVHLEINRPDLARYSSATEAAFTLGHEVGDVAVRLYGGDGGHYIDYDGGSLAAAIGQTTELMTSLFRAPIFEATLQHDGVLVREDVLLPVEAAGAHSWRIVEVKASTKLKPEHVQDCAVQAWVHLGAGHPLAAVALAHIDNGFTYAGDGDYRGLLVENDLTAEVLDLLPAVPGWVERARVAAAGPLPQVPVGQHCSSPYECPFLHVCWPVKGRDGVEYPVSGLGGNRKNLGLWVMNGYRDIRDVPAAAITSETQARIHRITAAGAAELLPGARTFVAQLPYPRFYLDFETIAPAIPVWAGTRPYQTLPIQWSCHIERAPGMIDHAEFLDLSGEPPMRALAESLIRTLEDAGPVLMYTDYERRVIAGLAGMYPDLAAPLQAVAERLVDLHPVTRANYYHPDMLGSWSIKAVLPTIAPDMDYAALEGIHEGTEASAAYLEAVHPETAPERREELRRNLLRYCRHDTEAMVRLLHFFAAA
jgi:hypothetical protein